MEEVIAGGLKKMLVDVVLAGRGVGLLDAHGDLAEELLHQVPRQRTGDVVYFDAGDTIGRFWRRVEFQKGRLWSPFSLFLWSLR